MEQLSLFNFPIKQNPGYKTMQSILIEHGVIQPSILFKSHVLLFGFKFSLENCIEFISQIKESYGYRRLESNKLRQSAYLQTILWNEIKSIEEALKDERLSV